MSSMCKVFAAVIVLLGVNVSSVLAMGSIPTSMVKEGAGKAAANFKLDTLTQTQVDMAKYRDGKKAIIFFWATWCPHCREQIKELNAQGPSILQKGIKILLVDIGEDADEVKAHAARNKINFDIFLDKDSTVAEEYQIIGVPTFYFIDEKGVVVAVTHALPENLEEVFKK